MRNKLMYLTGCGMLIFSLIACNTATTTPITVIPTSTTVVLSPLTTPTLTAIHRQATVSPTTVLTPAQPTTIPTLSQPLSPTLPVTPTPLDIKSLLSMNDPTGKLSVALALLANPISHTVTNPLTQDNNPIDNMTDGLVRNQQGEVLVYIRLANVPGTSIADLKDVGATITHEATGYGIITAFIPPNRLNDLAQLEVVESVQELLKP